MSAQHTPGPWKVFAVFADAEVRAEDGTLIAVVPGRLGVRNARAIAAVPELLAVAESYLEVLGEMGILCECGGPDCRTTRLRAAIAKATGTAPDPFNNGGQALDPLDNLHPRNGGAS